MRYLHSGHMTRDKTVLYLMIESNDRNSTDADCNNNMEVFTKQWILFIISNYFTVIIMLLEDPFLCIIENSLPVKV